MPSILSKATSRTVRVLAIDWMIAIFPPQPKCLVPKQRLLICTRRSGPESNQIATVEEARPCLGGALWLEIAKKILNEPIVIAIEENPKAKGRLGKLRK